MNTKPSEKPKWNAASASQYCDPVTVAEGVGPPAPYRRQARKQKRRRAYTPSASLLSFRLTAVFISSLRRFRCSGIRWTKSRPLQPTAGALSTAQPLPLKPRSHRLMPTTAATPCTPDIRRTLGGRDNCAGSRLPRAALDVSEPSSSALLRPFCHPPQPAD